MVGKIKRARQKLHQDAVRINSEGKKSSENLLEKTPELPLNTITSKPEQHTQPAEKKPRDVTTFNFPRAVFAGTVIPPEALVQTLSVSEPSAGQTAKQTAEEPRGVGEKKQQSKKEKMKERRERWLNKISAIKLAHKKQAELKRRRATPVVGDMRTLADALPELRPFIRAPASRKQKGVVKTKAEPTDFCQMKPAQKRKLLEMETSRFSEAMKDSTFKANPLTVIGEHLRKRLRQEDEQS
ncbi:ribosome biogenesis protein SLX9 homolog [Clarias gariepinus]|uniref:protein FAM207A n=1 Tax=Clarias gariepinus TaxID=13013 RepID=UPI00234CF417|nr:protein FAM207A [Clarias gariepinus]